MSGPGSLGQTNYQVGPEKWIIHIRIFNLSRLAPLDEGSLKSLHIHFVIKISSWCWWLIHVNASASFGIWRYESDPRTTVGCHVGGVHRPHQTKEACLVHTVFVPSVLLVWWTVVIFTTCWLSDFYPSAFHPLTYGFVWRWDCTEVNIGMGLQWVWLFIGAGPVMIDQILDLITLNKIRN